MQSRDKERDSVSDRTVSGANLSEGPIVPSPESNCRSRNGKLDLAVAISDQNLYFKELHTQRSNQKKPKKSIRSTNREKKTMDEREKKKGRGINGNTWFWEGRFGKVEEERGDG